jgi:hypothetical protein
MYHIYHLTAVFVTIDASIQDMLVSILNIIFYCRLAILDIKI